MSLYLGQWHLPMYISFSIFMETKVFLMLTGRKKPFLTNDLYRCVRFLTCRLNCS